MILEGRGNMSLRYDIRAFAALRTVTNFLFKNSDTDTIPIA